MQLVQISSVAFLLALTPFAAYQTPAKQPAPQGKKQDKSDRESAKSAPQEEAERVRQELLGVWQLSRFHMGNEDFGGAKCRGYLLVQGEFLSLELQVDSNHVRNLDNNGQLFSSGVQRWQYDESSLILTTTSMMGVSNFGPHDWVEYERTGTPREYRITFTDDESMTLDRDATTRLYFQRISRPEPPAPEEEPASKK